MLWPYGEVHVSHKTAVPFSHWNLEELAAENSLLLVECADFCIQDYPGYNNKRGDGSRSDIPFPLGKCSTFKFIIGHLKKKNPLRKTNLLPSSPSISPIIVNRLGYENIADMSYPEIPFPPFKEIPFPVNFELIPRTINGYEFRETPLRPFARPPFCRINQFSLRVHEPRFSTFTVPLTGSYNEELLEAPRRASLGYNYWSHYEEIRSRRVSMLECGRMLEGQVVLDEETRQRWMYLCHGI